MPHDTMDLARRLYSGARNSVSYALHPNDRDVYRLLETIHANTLILIEQGNLSLQREKTIMTGQDDLKASLTSVAATVSAIDTAVDQLIAAKNSGDDAAFEAAAQQIQALNTSLQSDVTKANSALTPPPAAA